MRLKNVLYHICFDNRDSLPGDAAAAADDNETGDMSTCEYMVLNINRSSRGGGVGIIYRQNLRIKQLDGSVQDALEMGLWKLTIANKAIHIMGIYHPPKSNTNNSTMNKFHEELSDYLTDNMNNYEELMIMGDTQYSL